MRHFSKMAALVLSVGLFLAVTVMVSAVADTRGPHPHPETRVYIDLTEGFYRALQEESHESNRTLSTGMSEDYLHQIAVAGRYMVETNFEVLRQQERIIRLLEEIRDRSPKR